MLRFRTHTFISDSKVPEDAVSRAEGVRRFWRQEQTDPPRQSHLGKKWNSMTIKAIEGGSLCPFFYVPFLKKSFEKKPSRFSYPTL